MHLTDEQLQELTQRVNARRAEFNIEGCPAILEPLTVGDVRMAATIYDEYATEVESAYYKQRDKMLEADKRTTVRHHLPDGTVQEVKFG